MVLPDEVSLQADHPLDDLLLGVLGGPEGETHSGCELQHRKETWTEQSGVFSCRRPRRGMGMDTVLEDHHHLLH